jgi:IS30 family transposase
MKWRQKTITGSVRMQPTGFLHGTTRRSGRSNRALGMRVWLRGLPETMRKTLTWDRRVELTWHAEFTRAGGIPVYFCDANCPCQ